ncbi:hypothetical protein VOLCADRAFT_103637 [Volvox carteri f. nagariensis]|uniref:RNB domain-containing protein n=1 Tax=Volvox carteri f. nagariensis TaxID=3068 RepID=D8TNJ5_VOLCA|nr:uncharacterized protein VOLCADRAFT_103637 [Volvox carteri f. nagariensis]EFJ50853.1 hypothetical protein VOLCADRAFT_103637 [Volvox carteri f. nagariensis]|eukprot:XP_002947865.1 hypothetical protein VOLCADRAFT_103637 [Volvox carteri f. nagariensis]
MSRAAATSPSLLMPDPPALRAPSRGRRAYHRPVPFRSYGGHSGASPNPQTRSVSLAQHHCHHYHHHQRHGTRTEAIQAAATTSSPAAAAATAAAAARARAAASSNLTATSTTPRRSYIVAAAAVYRGGGGTGSSGAFQPASKSSPGLASSSRAERLADERFRLQAVRGAGGTGSGSGSGQPGALQVGALVEYEKNDRAVLAVLVAPDGKKNWFAVDQTGRRQPITPKQVVFVLPGSGYREGDVAAFVEAAEGADMSMMEVVWEIAIETAGGPLELKELATLLYDDTTPRSLYVTHRMLQKDTLYFKPAPRGGAAAAAIVAGGSYIPRSAEEVAALRVQQEAAEAARKAAEAWRAAVVAARTAKTRAQQPSAAEWEEGPFGGRIRALKAIALSTPRTDDVTTQLALSSLQLVGAGSRAEPDAAAALLVEIGALRRHEPLQLLRRGLAIRTPAEHEQEAAALLAAPPPDPDAKLREDLTHLRVFTIDDVTTTEVDDGLSLERLEGSEGAAAGIRIWIHVADPTRWIRPGSNLDMAGRDRIRTLYLPWGSVPMFPRQLAEGPFSLREGQVCDAMSVCVRLNKDGSLERPRVVPSRVRVNHKLTYDQADAVLAALAAGDGNGTEAAGTGAGAVAVEDGSRGVLDVAAVADLLALREAALARRAYREACGCIEIPLPEAKINVPYSHLDRARPAVTISRISQWDSPSRSLVAEMMILAGEAVGAIGAEAALPLPYRSQDSPELPPASALAALPEGPCRGFALKRCMTRSAVGPSPRRHAALALDAYVQFTSPIRRYSDMVAHHNLKAWLRGDPLPFSGNEIESLMAAAGEAGRELGAAERESENYWVAEYLRLNWGAEYPAMALGWQREEMQLAAFLLQREGLEVVVRVPQGTAFRPGDCCVLAPSEVNPATGFYRFYIAGWTGGEEEAQPARRVGLATRRRQLCKPCGAIEIDFSDPDTQISLAGMVLGLVAGLGAPIWYINRAEKDEERLEELRALNRATYAETGEYMTEDEIAKIRKPKWTDRREWVDDD